MIRFRFEMRPLPDVSPWGTRLHWFALTDARYWIEIGGHELFRYTSNSEPPYVDYYAARLWEDILTMAADVLEPVPDDLTWLIERDSFALTDEHQDLAYESDACSAALSWHENHTLYTGPIVHAPRIRMWRRTADRDEVTVCWRNPDQETYAAPHTGRVTVPTPEYVAAVGSFDHQVIAAMEHRVTELERTGPPPGIDLDLPALRSEHELRATFHHRALSRTPATDWPTIRSGAATLRALS